MFPSYRNQSVDLLCKSTDWFLYDGIYHFLTNSITDVWQCPKYKSRPIQEYGTPKLIFCSNWSNEISSWYQRKYQIGFSSKIIGADDNKTIAEFRLSLLYFSRKIGKLGDLTHYSLVLLIYNPWKHQKTFTFQVFRGYR